MRFYVDYISHNGYLTWHALPRLACEYDLELGLVRVLFAGVLQAHGQIFKSAKDKFGAADFAEVAEHVLASKG